MDQTLDNPAAIAAALRYAGVPDAEFPAIIGEIRDLHEIVQAIDPAVPAYQLAKDDLDALLAQHGIEMDGNTVVIPNLAPDEGLSAPYNSWFTLFGQFFDHGLDLVAKGGNGTVYIPLQPDDPLYNLATPHTNFMALTRATVGEDAGNVTTPWVDQNQTYTSHASHQVFLREYEMVGGKPQATGHLLEGDRGLATWGDVKEQARTMLGIELTDADVTMVPLLRTDPYGNFIPDANGFAQIIVGIGADGIPNTADDVTVSGTPDAPASTANALRIPNAFLDDIAHAAAPVLVAGVLQQDGDSNVGYANADGTPGAVNSRGQQTAYDNELLDAHYVTGDGRGNENIGLSAVHHVFHSEHNRQVDQIKETVLATGDDAFIAEWQLEDGSWDGERLFQAARFATEMQYQHLVFEEFARKVQPDVDIFMVQPDVELDPAIFSEFANVVYRFGHSMLTQDVARIEADGSDTSLTLFDAFLNPLAFGSDTVSHDQAAGAIVRGMTSQVGNEIDEFVTDVLRNQLVGIPLDLAAINIARGRDTGMPTLNQAREQFQEMAGGDTLLQAYTSWVDFALNLKNPESIINFIAAYGTHETVVDAATVDEKRDAAMALVFGDASLDEQDRQDFLNGQGAYAENLGGLDFVDLWVGGLAEDTMAFGGMLGSTFSFIFQLQMENLQDADRFYYLSRTQGLNLLTELENNSLAKIVMLNTDLGETGYALPADIFSTPDHVLYMDHAKQMQMTGTDDPVHDNPTLEAFSSLVERVDADGNGVAEYIRYNGLDHIVIQGTDGNDRIVSGGGDDTVWGGKGNDRIEAGYGVDSINGGEGDVIITSSGTDIGAISVLKGEAGNDVIIDGTGMSLIFGDDGKDYLMSGLDDGEIRGGQGNDAIAGGDGFNMLFGNEGDDWIEGGAGFDYIAGDNAELFFNSTVIGHDVLNGGSGDTDYDADSGDDIMFAGEGIQKNIGMWGHDWVTHQGQATGADADMRIEVFTTLPLEVLRDRFSNVEALSGWKHDDVLRGDDRTVGEENGGTAVDPTPESDFRYNELNQAGIDRIAGLDQIITSQLMVEGEYWADGSWEDGGQGTTEAVFVGGNILLGGGGSDEIEGRGGDDVIDGDRYLNVRLTGTATDGTAFSVNGMQGDVTLGGVTKPLSSWMLEGKVNPGTLEIVREILDGNQAGDEDTAVYWDVRDAYEITMNADGSLTVAHVAETGGATDPVTGQNRVSDGVDRLYNIEWLRFADGTVSTASFMNAPATGAPAISDTTPTEGDILTVSIAGVSDADGMPATGYAYQWQYLNGTNWVDIPGATGASFTPNDPNILQQLFGDISEIGRQLRVEVTFTDNDGFVETVYSDATAAVAERSGQVWVRGLFTGSTFNGGAGDDHATGSSGVFGLGANETLNGNGGNDVLIGLGGNDTLNGGTGDDILDGGDGNDTLNGGAGTDVISAGAGNDTIIQLSTDGRDLISGGAGTDTYRLNGVAGAETFTIYTRAAALGAITGLSLAADTEIVVARNGSVIAELSGIEEIEVNTLNVTANDGNGTPNAGTSNGDTIQIVGDFSTTSLSYSTITVDGTAGDDVIDITDLASAHRIVFRTNGGNDTIVGSLRPQDVIELPAGTTLADYSIWIDNEVTTLTSEDHSITFSSVGGMPKFVDDSGAGHDDDDDHDDDHHHGHDDDDHDDDDSCDIDDDVDAPGPVTPAPATPASAITGTELADTLLGTTGGETIMGLGGRDIIFGDGGADNILGGAGDDMLYGDGGDDRIFGGDGDDLIDGGSGNDTLFGEAGNDIFVAKDGDGNDTYYGDSASGGSGIDTLDMSAVTSSIVADLGTGILGHGTASSATSGNDQIFGIENIITGSGNDVITASAAINRMEGGAGDDTFRFLSAADADGDTILGFQPGDKIDLSGMDADWCASGQQNFTLVSDCFTGARGELLVTYENRDGQDFTVVQGNTSGGTDAEFKITLKGSHELSNSDFIL